MRSVGEYAINVDNIAYVKFPEGEDSDGDAIVTFIGPGNQSAHELRFSGHEADALREVLNYERSWEKGLGKS